MKDEPAFSRPCSVDKRQGTGYMDGDEFIPAQSGMSLRDYFAAAAIQSVACGIIAEANHDTSAQSLAWSAFDIADAMLAARAKGGVA